MLKRLVMASMAILTVAVVPSAAEARFRPAVVFPAPLLAPTNLFLLPRGVYYYRAPQVDVYFQDGFWWSPFGGAWYRADSYEGPWVVVEPRFVPPAVLYLPSRVPVLLPRAERVPWARWRENHYGPGWRDHREPGWERHERRDDRGFDRDRRGGGPGFQRGRDDRGAVGGHDRNGPGNRGRPGDRTVNRGGGRSGPPQRGGQGRR